MEEKKKKRDLRVRHCHRLMPFHFPYRLYCHYDALFGILDILKRQFIRFKLTDTQMIKGIQAEHCAYD